jgi:hypothetical protein
MVSDDTVEGDIASIVRNVTNKQDRNALNRYNNNKNVTGAGPWKHATTFILLVE